MRKYFPRLYCTFMFYILEGKTLMSQNILCVHSFRCETQKTVALNLNSTRLPRTCIVYEEYRLLYIGYTSCDDIRVIVILQSS